MVSNLNFSNSQFERNPDAERQLLILRIIYVLIMRCISHPLQNSKVVQKKNENNEVCLCCRTYHICLRNMNSHSNFKASISFIMLQIFLCRVQKTLRIKI